MGSKTCENNLTKDFFLNINYQGFIFWLASSNYRRSPGANYKKRRQSFLQGKKHFYFISFDNIEATMKKVTFGDITVYSQNIRKIT